ncbi:MAG: hypothetical protein VYE72_05230, partial [Candidatus Thermoplasmatota archaeon]|nr:hypothetical protein [Candidatus Thermoplasmatota archaeon]
MNETSARPSLPRTAGKVMLPFTAVIFGVAALSGVQPEGTLVRFSNAMLTSFTLFSFMLLLTLFVYGDARKRPFAPLLGMGL